MQLPSRFLSPAAITLRKYKTKAYLKSHDIRKLQIGCGINLLDGWLNTDVFLYRKGVVFLNAKRRLPLEDRTFDYIFAEHFIEHLDYNQGCTFLHECFRILKPGSKIRLATPDLNFLVRIYSSQRSELEERYVKWIAESSFPHAQTALSVLTINQWFRGFGHRFIYDYETLEHSLVGAGFSNVKRYNVGESDDVNLCDIERHGCTVPSEFNQLETMVVEAVKQ
jgi:predicted SAM-dependent methyltransferase